jgi:hypothetical protein
MDESRRSRRDLIQNIAILLLSVSAVLLFVRTQLLSRDTVSGWLPNLFSAAAPAADAAVSAPTELTGLSVPVRIVVTGAYGRYGNIAMTTTDEGFSVPGSRLREALASAGDPDVCTEKDFRKALSTTSAYYDFGTDLPLSVVAGLVGADAPVGNSEVRQLALSSNEGGVRLYWTDGRTYSCCKTAVTREDLAELVNSYQLGNASFAFDLGDGTDLAPYSLFLTDDLPSFPVLAASDPLGNSDSLLSALGFNPRTKNRYAESSGTEVIMDGDRRLRILSDGTVVYESGSDAAALQIPAAGDVPTAEEAVMGSCQLLSSMLGDGGDAALCPLSVHRSGNAWTLTFGYQVGGIPVRRSDGSPAAEVQISGTEIRSLSLYLRQYAITDGESLLLPLPQALAIAGKHAGAEMDICYTDGGADTVSACWLAE